VGWAVFVNISPELTLFSMNKLFTTRRILAILAIIIGFWLLYPLVFGSPPVNLNVFLGAGHAPSSYITKQIFHTLGDLDPKTQQLRPLLVTSIPVVRQIQEGPRKGNFAYDFAIIPEAVWDNGTPVTAEDVAFTLKTIMHPDLSIPYKAFLDQLSAMEIDPSDPKKFTIYFQSFYMLTLEALCGTPILPAYHYDTNQRLTRVPLADFLDTSKTKMLSAEPSLDAFEKEFSDPRFVNDPNSVIGSGPYRLQVMNDQGAVLVKKTNWWGEKVWDKYPMLQAYPKKLVYKVVADDLAMENQIKSGQLDLIGGSINPAKFLEWKESDSLKAKFDFLAQGYVQYNRWLVNHKNPVLADPIVRKALTHVVDYDYVINQVQRGMAVRLASPMVPNKPFYHKSLELPDFNIEKARMLLTSAGWTDTDGDGFLEKELDGQRQKLSFKLLVPAPHKSNELVSINLKENCRQAGIDLQLVSQDMGTVNADTKTGNYDSALLGVTSNNGWIDYSQRIHSKNLVPAGDNRSNYASAEADRLIDAIRTEPDETKRNQYYLELQALLAKDLPEIPMFAPLQRIIFSKKLDPSALSELRPGYYEQFAKMRED
jgi:peptide/nickel transport system substrate-binding protein